MQAKVTFIVLANYFLSTNFFTGIILDTKVPGFQPGQLKAESVHALVAASLAALKTNKVLKSSPIFLAFTLAFLFPPLALIIN